MGTKRDRTSVGTSLRAWRCLFLVAPAVMACGSDDDVIDVIRVTAGESIQAAVDGAKPGTVIEVEPGEYHEAVRVSTAGITLRGIVRDGARPVLDGHGELDNGILAFFGEVPIHVHEETAGEDHDGQHEHGAAETPRRNEGEEHAEHMYPVRDDHPRISRFEISGFEIRNYTENGIYTSHIDNIVIRDVRAISDTEDPEKRWAYGIYPLEAENMTVEDCYVEGAWDAGYYLSVSEKIVAKNNEAAYNTAGFEMENAVDVEVADNYAHDNAGGILIFLLPGLPSKVSRNTLLRNNRIENNNGPNMGKPKALVSNIPSGTGIFILSGDAVTMTNNTIKGHDTMGVGIASFKTVFPSEEASDIEVVPQSNRIQDNTFGGNGANPSGLVKDLGLSGGDVLWDGQGEGNCASDNGEITFSLFPLGKC